MGKTKEAWRPFGAGAYTSDNALRRNSGMANLSCIHRCEICKWIRISVLLPGTKFQLYDCTLPVHLSRVARLLFLFWGEKILTKKVVWLSETIVDYGTRLKINIIIMDLLFCISSFPNKKLLITFLEYFLSIDIRRNNRDNIIFTSLGQTLHSLRAFIA